MSERTKKIKELEKEIADLSELISYNKEKLTKKPDNYWQIESILKKQEEKLHNLLRKKLFLSY